MNSIRNNITDEQKKILRNIKYSQNLPDRVKAVVYEGNNSERNGPDPILQFHRDLELYNLWEAILYVESYEDGAEGAGFYKEGTAQKSIDAFFNNDKAKDDSDLENDEGHEGDTFGNTFFS